MLNFASDQPLQQTVLIQVMAEPQDNVAKTFTVDH